MDEHEMAEKLTTLESQQNKFDQKNNIMQRNELDNLFSKTKLIAYNLQKCRSIFNPLESYSIFVSIFAISVP